MPSANSAALKIIRMGVFRHLALMKCHSVLVTRVTYIYFLALCGPDKHCN